MSDELTPKLTICDSCRFPTRCTPVRAASAKRDGEILWLCTLCSNSLIGSAHDYGHQELPIVRAIAFVGNTILTALQVDPALLEQQMENLFERAEEKE